MTQGVYALIIENGNEKHLQIGKLGNFLFIKGLYVYIGSALGRTSTSLEHRLKRHLSSVKKKLFWHIDFFLNSNEVEVFALIFSQTSERKECELAYAVSQIETAQILVRRFGASDCACLSHLYYFSIQENELIDLIKSAFSKLNLKPILQNQKVS
ncbi:MAG: GIY-YIG nuclease family protein [Candidatus Helarchaeota archaeon]|nr:GIY-YIG nuclease family protein [Candidatus Helarchaeota archaeon]